MSTNATIGAIVGILVIGIAGTFIFMADSDKKETAPDNTTQTAENERAETEQEKTQNVSGENQMTQEDAEYLQAAIADGEGELTCEYTAENQSGTFYLDHDQMAVVAYVQGAPTSHMVAKNGKTYIWAEGQSNGMIVSKNMFQVADEQQDNIETSSDFSGQYGFDYDNPSYKYDCETAAVAESHFEIPGDVNFTDMAQMMQGSMQEGQ